MREQCFQIVLSGRVENADKRGYRPDDKNDYTRADHRGREQVHIDARDAIDTQIQNHTRKQCGHVARRRRMRPGKPAAARHQSRFDAETEEGQ